jgi:hypothetical protein
LKLLFTQKPEAERPTHKIQIKTSKNALVGNSFEWIITVHSFVGIAGKDLVSCMRAVHSFFKETISQL